MPVALHIWVSIHHLIVFCCTSSKWWYLQILFFIFSKFRFSGFLRGGGLKGKKGSKMTRKICLTPYLRNCTSYDCGFWYACRRWWYFQQFFFIFFQNSDFLGFSKFTYICQKEILSFAPSFFVRLIKQHDGLLEWLSLWSFKVMNVFILVGDLFFLLIYMFWWCLWLSYCLLFLIFYY